MVACPHIFDEHETEHFLYIIKKYGGYLKACSLAQSTWVKRMRTTYPNQPQGRYYWDYVYVEAVFNRPLWC